MARNTLMNIVRKRLQAAPVGPGAPEETAQAQRLLRAKTGRAVTPRGPAPTALGERVAAQQAAEAGQRQAAAGALQAEAFTGRAGEIERRETLAGRELEQSRAEAEGVLRRQETQLFGELERAGKKLDMDKDRVKLEQLGFLAGLQDRGYMDQLIGEGRTRRLDDKVTFQETLQESVYSDFTEALRENSDFNEALGADNRTFERELAEIDLDFAISMATAQASAAGQRAIFEGIGTGVTAVASIAGRTPTTPTPEAPGEIRARSTVTPRPASTFGPETREISARRRG